MRILVTGASGFIGRSLVPALEAAGHEVVALRRGSNGVPVDLRGIGQWGGWPSDLDTVVHLGALNPDRSSAEAKDDAALIAANSTAAKALAVRAAQAGVSRFVFMSTALVHPASASPVSEQSPIQPQNAYAASKHHAEMALADALNGTATELVILRFPPVYGPGGRGGIAGLIRLAGSPIPLPLGNASGQRSLLARENAVEAIRASIEASHPIGGTYLVADSETISVAEIVRLVRQTKRLGTRLLPVPASLVRTLAKSARREAFYERLFQPFVVSDRAFRERTGWSPPVQTQDAIAALAEHRGAPL